jgi:ABC-2 type transport system permease protein
MRTEQLLLTAPVTITGMVLGKYLAAFTLFLGTVIASCINFFPLYVLGFDQRAANETTASYKFIGVNTAQILGSLLGIILVGAVFIAIGMFISSLTENQLSAAVITIACLASMLVINFITQAGSEEEGTRLIGNYFVRAALDWFSVFSRFGDFGYGILDFASLLYYVSFAIIFIYLTIRVFEKRRWS